jgi:SAM-dependent methyltransferase
MGMRRIETLWNKIEHHYIKPILRRLKPWRKAIFGRILVYYKTHLDGGRSSFGQEFIPFFRDRRLPNNLRLFEWCAGPGFIGFSMLGHGLCETLCLADINSEAVAACQKTIRTNRIDRLVSFYQSDNLKSIPSSEQWDLVLSNSPHFSDHDSDDLRSDDRDWHIHRSFFSTVGRFLKPGGVIVLQENNYGSTVDSFREMIEQAGLSIVFVSGGHPMRTPKFHFYFIGIMRRGETPPAWATNING